MALKKYKPTSPGRRFMSVSTFEEVTKTTPERSLTEPLKKTGGRNNNGRITTRHQGGGHKRRYRVIDFKRTKDGVPAKVAAIEYDPNRSARIALLHYLDGAKAYIIAPARLRVGAMVESGPAADIKPGNALPLENIPTGTMVHNVELKPGQGAKMARSAGASVQLVAKDDGYGVLRLPSGEMRRVPLTCRATVGQVGNTDHENQSGGKAGRSRWKGKRPAVRGSAMNPVDHPHGGGEGKSKGGRHPVTPWGVPTLGKRTRREAQGIQQADRSRPPPREGQALSEQIVEEGAFRGGAADEPDRVHERGQREADDSHLVALVHDLPRHGRAHDRGPRRPQARAGLRQRADGRAQARRVRPHPDVQGPRRRPAGQGARRAASGCDADSRSRSCARRPSGSASRRARRGSCSRTSAGAACPRRGRSSPSRSARPPRTSRRCCARPSRTPRRTRSCTGTATTSIVKAAYADEGPTLKRWRPRARGRVNQILKRTCHITIELAQDPKAGQTRRPRAAAPTTTEAPAPRRSPLRSRSAANRAKKKEAVA